MWWLRPKSVPVTSQAAADPDPHILPHSSLWRVRSLGNEWRLSGGERGPADKPWRWSRAKGEKQQCRDLWPGQHSWGCLEITKRGSDKRRELSAAPQGGTWPKWWLTGPSVLTCYDPILHLPAFTKRKSFLLSNLQHSCCYLKLLPQFSNLPFDGSHTKDLHPGYFCLPSSSVQSLGRVWLFATPWTAAHQASLSITNSQSLLSLVSIESVMPSNHFILCRPLFLPASGSFPINQFFVSGGQNIGVSASASVLPMNIQDLFPLGLTGWISLQSKGLSRVFNTTVQKHHSSALSFLDSPTLTSIHDHWKNHSLD